ncbi:MAG: [protein-PII] uridylyltransferase [Rhodospirillales bacterium]|nr:[protein-PII] uridylyltransferase [Rhodospirillales bacterium]
MTAHAVAKPRAILDRKALIGTIEALAADPAISRGKFRPKLVEALKAALAHGRTEIRGRFESGRATGLEAAHATSRLVDQLVRVIHDVAVEKLLPQGVRTAGEQLTIVAVGGYGRGELSPFSDIDLLFLHPQAKPTAYTEQVVETILYLLWDLGFTVGHATRSVEECLRQAKGDMTIRTALLEARWLWGERAPFDQLKARYRKELAAVAPETFVEQKLEERNQRHERLGDSRYLLEPNVKEGKGGLRDLHTLGWIAKYLYGITDMRDLAELGLISVESAARFARARNFLLAVRAHLHYLSGREEDRLTFDVQSALAERMGYAARAGAKSVERFMKHYFLIAKTVGDLTRIVCALIETRHAKKPKARLLARFPLFKRPIEGFRVASDRLDVVDDNAFVKEPIRLLSIFKTALDHDLDIHPRALGLIDRHLRRLDGLRHDPQANRLFLDILVGAKDSEICLRSMNEAGVFGRFLPDFARVVGQMQYDMYHVYTVDEHTIRALGILHRIETGALKDEHAVGHQIMQTLQSRRALYVAVLLHDIAKGRVGDHSEVGAEIALKLGPRLGLEPEETETVSWLVRHHLDMSRTAFKRDIDDPKTIQDFADLVQSPERLKLLLLLTFADIRAVGPSVWNNWKAGLLRELYWRADEVMSGGLAAGESRRARAEQVKTALRQALAASWSAEAIEAHLARGNPSYWLSADLETLIAQAELVREAEDSQTPLTVRHRIDAQHAATEVTIYTGDHPGLFAQIAGAMALSGASIVDARIVTLANGMALDSFWIQDAAEGGALSRPDRLTRLADTIEKALKGQIRLDRELKAKRSTLPSRTRVFTVAPRVILDNRASRTHTVIEVNGRDRPGFLYDVTAALTAQGLQIFSAHISTYGERAVDVFYVKDVFGMKVDHEGKLKQIREALLDAVAGAEGAIETPAKLAVAG